MTSNGRQRNEVEQAENRVPMYDPRRRGSRGGEDAGSETEEGRGVQVSGIHSGAVRRHR